MSGPQRILGIDFGERRIGLAVSDESGVRAEPLETLELQRKRDIWPKLKALIGEYCVERAVVGYPLHMSGEVSERAEICADFAGRITKRFAIPADLWDERWTSKQAERMLGSMGGMGKRGKGVIDAMAAVIILQSYLDARGALEATP